MIRHPQGALTMVSRSGAGTSKIGPKRPAHLAFAGGRPLICVLP